MDIATSILLILGALLAVAVSPGPSIGLGLILDAESSAPWRVKS